MSESTVAMTGIALLVAATMWFALRMAAAADLHVLPASTRRRLHWWQVNSRLVYLLCAALAAASLAVQLQQSVI